MSPPLFSSSSADLSSAQCIPAPLATPIPVSDDPSTSVVTPCTDLSESPSSQALPPMPYSVPVSEHMEECSSSSIIKGDLDSLLACIPKKVSEVSEEWKFGYFYRNTVVFLYICIPEHSWSFVADNIYCLFQKVILVSWSRIQSRVLSPPTSPIRRWVSGLRTLQTFQLLHPSFPQPSSAPPSLTFPLWSLTRRWASGTRVPPMRRTHWEASPRGPQMEKRRRESQLAGWTRCLSTLFLVSRGV